MSVLVDDAERIFEGACIVSNVDTSPTDLAIIVDRTGGIRLMEASGWQLESLEASYGAQRIYRVTHNSGHVRVEGKSGSQRCLIESAGPPRTAARHPRPDVVCQAT
jgi:hypothetical protein